MFTITILFITNLLLQLLLYSSRPNDAINLFIIYPEIIIIIINISLIHLFLLFFNLFLIVDNKKFSLLLLVDYYFNISLNIIHYVTIIPLLFLLHLLIFRSRLVYSIIILIIKVKIVKRILRVLFENKKTKDENS